MNHKVAIIIPSTINGNETAPRDLVAYWVKTAKVRFAKFFGGYTSHHATGGWVSEEYGLIEEEVTVVASFTDDDGMDLIDSVRKFAAEIAEALNQEAVALEVDHRLELVAACVAA